MKRVIALLVLLGVFVTVEAQETKPDSKNKPSEELGNLQLACQLAEYGYKTFSATALIEAARIMSSIKTHELKVDSYRQDPLPKETSKKQAKEGLDVTSILETARKYAVGDAKLLASIDEIEKINQETRGRVGGPGEKYSYVYGNSSDTYEISFIASELAEIVVIGDRDTDLDLYVHDSNGNLITRDDDYTDRCYVGWVPKWTGRYIVKIVNRGPILNYYRLVTN